MMIHVAVRVSYTKDPCKPVLLAPLKEQPVLPQQQLLPLEYSQQQQQQLCCQSSTPSSAHLVEPSQSSGTALQGNIQNGQDSLKMPLSFQDVGSTGKLLSLQMQFNQGAFPARGLSAAQQSMIVAQQRLQQQQRLRQQQILLWKQQQQLRQQQLLLQQQQQQQQQLLQQQQLMAQTDGSMASAFGGLGMAMPLPVQGAGLGMRMGMGIGSMRGVATGIGADALGMSMFDAYGMGYGI